LETVRSPAYPPDARRDLRIDFIRGVVMFILVVNHIEAFSWFGLLTWERFGIATGGEGFVILSGFVLGMIYRDRIERDGWGSAIDRLVDRSLQLYRINLFVILSVFLLNLLPFPDASAAMTYVNRESGAVYPLYPGSEEPMSRWIARFLLLRAGPHQFQIMGLYVILIFATPAALWLIRHRRTGMLLGLSWIAYAAQQAWPSRPTGAQFEYAFPVLAWQLPFFHGLAAGCHRDRVAALWRDIRFRRLFLAVGTPILLLCLFYALNNPNPRLPDWAKMSAIPPDTFWTIYEGWFRKDMLGIGRLVNYFFLLSFGYLLLTHLWRPIHRALGWFFVPVGQASLYVFIVHVYLVMLIYNFPFFFANAHTVTLACFLALAAIWFMVRYKVLFRWIPR
jgi:hypothetical protein